MIDLLNEVMDDSTIISMTNIGDDSAATYSMWSFLCKMTQ